MQRTRRLVVPLLLALTVTASLIGVARAGGLDPLVPSQVIRILDRLGLTTNGAAPSGTSGYVWTANGAGVAASFQAAAGGGFANPATGSLDMASHTITGVTLIANAGVTDYLVLTSNQPTLYVNNSPEFLLTPSTGTFSHDVAVTGTMASSNVQRGSGSPEGAVTGVVGDVYQRTNGGASTALYIKESGSGNTGWTALGAGGGGSTTYTVLDGAHGMAPISTSTFCANARRNSHIYQEFDVSTNMCCDWEFTCPRSYTGGTLTVQVEWEAATATAGAVKWGGSIETANGLDTDGDSFDTEVDSDVVTTNATCGKTSISTITFTAAADADGMVAGDLCRFRLRRETESASDTMLGGAQVLVVRLSD